MGDLSTNFSMDEFACRDGCGLGTEQEHYDVYGWPQMIDDLETIRSSLGVPIFIESGLRCEAHNRSEGGVDNSAHMRCAVDVRLGYFRGPNKYHLVKCAFELGFTGIGLAKTFAHLDRDTVKARPAIWIY